MGFPIIDDMNGPMRPGAGYINMNIGSDGARASSARTFLRPNLSHSNLTLMLNTHAKRILFEGDRARGVELVSGGVAHTIEVTREVILAAGTIHSAKPIDIALILEQFPIATPDAAARFAAPPEEGFTIAPALTQPTSRGQVALASADWRDAPVIQPNYLSTDHDLNAIIRAAEAARRQGHRRRM